MIELLPHLQGTLAFIPVFFQDYLDARLYANCMDKSLKRPERKKILDHNPSGCVLLQNASIA
jgi:hypothetical protein